MKIIKVLTPVKGDGILGDIESSISEQCLRCNNLRAPYVCKAFPDGIPAKIALEGFDHRNPFESDKGIRFESLDVSG